jgi:Co/Zn/Cd efflux system component
MASCCEDKGCEVSALRESHSRVLWAVLIINAVMFVVEAYSGLVAHSTSWLADSLDMLGDAIVYGFSLFVLAKSLRWQAVAAVIKGVFMLAFGVGVLLEAIYKIFNPVIPNAELIDLNANTGVLLAAAASYWLTSRWPDIAVGTIIAGLFLHSSVFVLKEALEELRKPTSVPARQPQSVVVGMPFIRNKK